MNADKREQLIEEVKHFPCLYNLNVREYKDRNMKQRDYNDNDRVE